MGLKHASNCHSGSNFACHESKRTLGNGTGNRYPRSEGRGVLFPWPCLWPRDLLIAVLCGQVALLRIAALRAGITQGAAPPKSAIVVVEGRPLYTILVGMYGGLWLQEWEQSPSAVGRKPLLSSKVQPSLPDRYGPTPPSRSAHKTNKTAPATPTGGHPLMEAPGVSNDRTITKVYTSRFVVYPPGTYAGAVVVIECG